MTGYSDEEHYADPDLGFKLVHPDDVHILEQAAGGGEAPLVLRWVRKDGTVLWTEQRNVPVFDADGQLVAIEGIARDITRQKNAEDALRRSHDELDRRVEGLLNSLSHEIRTPLRTMVSLSELLQTDHAGELSAEAHDLLSRVVAAGQVLDGLLLSLVQGKISLPETPVPGEERRD